MSWHFPIWRIQRNSLFLAVALGLITLCSSVPASAQADSLAGTPVVGRNADGQLEVFKVDLDGELRHRWQKESNGDWSSWSSLGGGFLPGIAIAPNAVGEMTVFAVSREDHALRFIRQNAPNSHDWSDWVSLGGAVQPPVAAAANADGRLEVFAVEALHSTVKHIWQTDTQANWSSWADLGGRLEPGPAVGLNRDGRLELFGVVATNHSLVHCWQRAPNSSADWSGWANLGGSVLPGVVVARNAADILEVFAVNATNTSVQRICQTVAAESLHWTPWLNFGGDVLPGLAVGQSAFRRIELFAIARDATLMHRWELFNNGSDQWSPWTSIDEVAQPQPAVGENEDGNLEVFAIDLHNRANINHRRQISLSSGWLDWASLDHTTFQYSSRTWQIDEGLPHNQVQALAQTRDGYLWVGTGVGLARFNGVEFTSYDAKTTPEIKNPSITALCADRDGALWIGTDGGGVARLHAGKFSHFGAGEGLAGDTLKVIYQTRDGSVWMGTTTGMSRYHDGKFTNYTRKEGLSSELVSSLYEDDKTNLWIATGEGLNRLKAGKMESFAMPNRLPGDSVRAICQDKGGRVWIGSNNGMLWYSSYWTNFYAYNTRYGLSDTFVSAICQDREANLWVGTYSGLNRFHEGRYFPQLNNEGMPFDRVNALLEDREGNLWVGSREGLTRLTPNRFVTYTKRQGLTHNNIMSVLEDRAGSLWIGTWGGGVDQLKNERVIAYATTNDFSHALVLSICEGRDGSLWFGADFDGGLTRIKDHQLTHYTAKDGLLSAPIHVIHEDRAGTLWIGTSQGLACLRNGKFITYTAKDGLAGNVIRAICEDHAGALWFGSETGLSRWKDGRFTNFTPRDGLSDATVTALYEDKERDLWVGTEAGGLNRYRNGRFTTYTTQQGLFSDEIFEVLEDDDGWLWMSSSKGVFRVRKRELDAFDRHETKVITSRAYGKADGIESPQCNGAGKPAGWKTRDGRLWFPTSKGLIVVDPKTTTIDPTPPPVVIETVMADRKKIFDVPSPGAAAAGSRSPLRIPAGRGEIEFHYSALSFRTPEKCRFKYKLEGVDPDWLEAGGRRTAHYNNIYPGAYTFRVQACNEDGVWNQLGGALAFDLQPHLWQTWWFRGLAGLLVIGAASGTARHQTRKRMQRRLELLEQRHAIDRERARIAKDMHDQLGAGLTQVGLLGELARRDAEKPDRTQAYAGKICDLAREQAQTLDEIVWTVDPKNDLLNKLAAYMAVYAEEFFRTADVRCRLDIPPGLPPYPLSAELRHNLFLTVKEALNNIVKHAHASEVWLRFSLLDSSLQVVIEDNGRGFSVEAAESSGNGLANMRHRIREIGGELQLHSRPAEGTRLSFRIPLKQGPCKSP